MAPAASASRGHRQGVPGLAAADLLSAEPESIERMSRAHRKTVGPAAFYGYVPTAGSVSTGQCPACLAFFWPLRDFLPRDVSPTATESVGGFGKLRNLHKTHSFTG